LSYLIFYDHSLPEDHPDNYYFEREWRMLDNLNFTLDDVKRIFIPENYSKQFQKDLPEYPGEIFLIKQNT
jgi:hypothetical protein